jgi:radical SAM protein with 4Fe4S-binding SPASM domain
MTIDDLKTFVSQKFNVLCFVDLADLRNTHRAIFDLLISVHKDRFENNDRIILYSAYKPEQQFLNHIHRAISRVDISTPFILIITPYSLQPELKVANDRYGFGHEPMQSLQVQIEYSKPFGNTNFYNVETLCAMPFSQAQVSTNGNVKPCCRFNESFGNIYHESLDKIFKGKDFENLRNQLLSGQKPSGCSICWQSESQGTSSLRQLSMQKYGDLLDRGWIDNVQVRDLTWSSSSLCNFKCRICDPRSSTQIASEEIKFAPSENEKNKLRTLIKETSNLQQSSNFIESILELRHLNFLHILGGEPFLYPKFDTIIDRLIDEGISNEITLEVNTNCSIYPESVITKIVHYFQAAEFLLSVDNVNERFEIERGGTWSVIYENIKKFASLRSDTVKVKLAATINLQNILYLDDIIDLSHETNLDILWWYLEDPTFLCIDYATEQAKKLIVQKYANHNDKELRQLSNRVLNSPGSDGLQFLEHCKKLDIRRNQCFSDSHAEIYRAMGG